jgi:hypothetical protein
MLPKHCESCRQLFAPQGVGLGFVFCKSCVHYCEAAYQKIRLYLLDNPGTPAASISHATGITGVFVYHLFRLGRFASDLSRRKSTEKKPCALCRRALQLQDEIYCTPCNTIIEKRMHSRYSRASVRSTPGTDNPSNRVGRRERHHYGFGRSL